MIQIIVKYIFKNYRIDLKSNMFWLVSVTEVIQIGCSPLDKHFCRTDENTDVVDGDYCHVLNAQYIKAVLQALCLSILFNLSCLIDDVVVQCFIC